MSVEEAHACPKVDDRDDSEARKIGLLAKKGSALRSIASELGLRMSDIDDAFDDGKEAVVVMILQQQDTVADAKAKQKAAAEEVCKKRKVELEAMKITQLRGLGASLGLESSVMDEALDTCKGTLAEVIVAKEAQQCRTEDKDEASPAEAHVPDLVVAAHVPLSAVIQEHMLGVTTVFKIAYAPAEILSVPGDKKFTKYVILVRAPDIESQFRGVFEHASELHKSFAGLNNKVLKGQVSASTWQPLGGSAACPTLKISGTGGFVDVTEEYPDFVILGVLETAFLQIPKLGDMVTLSVSGIVQSLEKRGELHMINLVDSAASLLRIQGWHLTVDLRRGDAVKVICGEVDLQWKRVNFNTLSCVSVSSRDNVVPALATELEWPGFQRPDRSGLSKNMQKSPSKRKSSSS